MMPSLDRVRATVSQARDVAGRAGTVGGAAVLVASLTSPQPLAVVLLGTAAAAGGGYLISVAGAQDPPPLLKALYLAPASALVAEAVVFQATSGLRWWEIAAAAAWSGLTWWLRPSRLARDWITPPGQDDAAKLVYNTVTTTAPPPPDVPLTGPVQARLASFWAAFVGVEGGPVPGTRLERVTAAGPRRWSAHIVATVPGQPVPSIAVNRLSALMDIPEDLFKVGPVPGAGAGRKQIQVGSTAAPTDFASLWAEQVAPAAMPGTTVVSVRRGTTGPDDKPRKEDQP